MSHFPKPTRKFEDVCAVPTADLIEAYRGSIDMLRAALSKEIEAHKLVEKADPNFGDDIYLLRFVLSHHKKGGFSSAVKYVTKTMAWRSQHVDLLYDLRVHLRAAPHDDKIRPYMAGGLHYAAEEGGHSIFLVRNGLSNPHVMMKTGVTAEELAEWFVFTKECAHAYCDAKTRQLGRLIKVVAIQDCNHIAMANFNKVVMSALTSSSHLSEGVYPQLLKKSLIVNLPLLFRHVASLSMMLMPQSVQEKVAICTETSDKKIAKFISKEAGVPRHDLPTFLGGECTCGGAGCVSTIPNDVKHMLSREDTLEKYPMRTWPEYVTIRLGQPHVSKMQGRPWPFTSVSATRSSANNNGNRTEDVAVTSASSNVTDPLSTYDVRSICGSWTPVDSKRCDVSSSTASSGSKGSVGSGAMSPSPMCTPNTNEKGLQPYHCDDEDEDHPSGQREAITAELDKMFAAIDS